MKGGLHDTAEGHLLTAEDETAEGGESGKEEESHGDVEHPDWFVEHTWEYGPLGITVIPAHRDPHCDDVKDIPEGVILIDHPKDDSWPYGDIEAGMSIVELNRYDVHI